MENLNFSDKIKLEIENSRSNFLVESRNESKSYIMSNNLPTLKHEDWKYNNLTFLNKINFNFNPSEVINSNFVKDDFVIKGLDAYTIFSINGKIDFSMSNFEGNFKLLDLSEKNLEKFNQIDSDRQTYFSHLNNALFNNGIYLAVGNNVIIDKPIHIIHINDSSNDSPMVNSRRMFTFGNNTEATVIESFFNYGNNKSFYNGVAEIYVGENSIIHHVKLQQDEKSDVLIDLVQAYQQKYSNYVNLTFTNAGNFVRNNLNAKLNDENIESHFLGVFVGDGNNVIDNHTFVDHAKPNCFSNENYRGILFDKSTGIFNGKILVRKDAQKTNAYQSNKNILASKDATINTKPELEIYADDVKCSHGATSGSLDKSSLFNNVD